MAACHHVHCLTFSILGNTWVNILKREEKQINETTSGVATCKCASFRTSCLNTGWESLCCIFLDKFQQKERKHRVKRLFFFFSVIFVLERIDCVRVGVLLAYIFGPTGTAKTWNYHFLAPHNIVPQCEEIHHLEKNKSVTKTQTTTLLFRGLGRNRIKKNPSNIWAILSHSKN